MSLYESTLARIVPRNKEIERAIGEQWSKGTPYGSYGKLATMVWQKSVSVPTHKR